MAYTKSQARKLAEQIHSRFGLQIAVATVGTPVPPEFVAGLIGVEAGKDRNGQINPNATRFEKGVYAKLKQIRDGQRRSWSYIKTADIRDASDAALKNLATSFGVCQVMGWHTIHNLDCTIAELRDPNKHLRYAVQLLMLNSKDGDFERKEYVGEFREWNTGSEQGKTYHADYVANAGAVMDAYRELPPVAAEPTAAELVQDLKTEVPAPKTEPSSNPQINVEHAEQVKASEPNPIPGGAKDDPPKQASQGGGKSTVATILGVLGGVGTALKGWLDSNNLLAVVGVICLMIVLLAWMFRQFIMDYLRMKYMSDPTKINVK